MTEVIPLSFEQHPVHPELFSVEVYFKKNMILKLNGEARQDIVNSRYYYAKLDGNWLVVDMQSVTE